MDYDGDMSSNNPGQPGSGPIDRLGSDVRTRKAINLGLPVVLSILGILTLLFVSGRAYLGLIYRQATPRAARTIASQSTLSPTVGTAAREPAISPPSDRIANWNTYYDGLNGLELQYPGQWSQLVLSDKIGVALTPHIPPEPLGYIGGGLSGVTIWADKIEECSGAKENIPNVDFPSVTIKPFYLSGRDGFIVQGLPGPGEPIGQDVFIFRCPTMIEIHLDPTDVKNGEQIFKKILSTLRVWTPKTSRP